MYKVQDNFMFVFVFHCQQYQRHGSESSPYQDLQDMSLVCVVCVGSDRCLAVAQSGTGWRCGTLGTSA